jgi:hypothetical protein
MVKKWLCSHSCWSHAPVRLAGIVTLALLCSLAGVCTIAQPARASCQPCGTGPGQISFGGVTASSSNTFGDFTLIPGATDPNAFLEVTADGSHAPMDTHQVGVWYDTSAGQWGVFNEDGSAMPTGVSFNVYTQQYPTAYAFLATVPSGQNSYIFFLNGAGLLNNNPSAELVVTQNWDPYHVYNPHPIGVWYDPWVGEWTIYNEDGSAIKSGAAFNVYVANAAGAIGGKVEVATSSNTTGATFCMNDVVGDWRVFATHVYNGTGYLTDVVGSTLLAGTQEWCLTDAAGNAIPIGTEFFLF